MSIQDSLWFQRLPAARAADQRGNQQFIPPMGYDPMASNNVVGNVIGGYDEPLASETVMPAAGQGAPPTALPHVQVPHIQDNPPPGTAGTNPNSGGNLAAANAEAQGQNVPTGGTSPQGGGQPTTQQRAAAGMGAIDINTLAGMMALNPSMAAQLLALFAGQMGMGQQTAPTPQAESPPPEQRNRNISGINFRFG